MLGRKDFSYGTSSLIPYFLRVELSLVLSTSHENPIKITFAYHVGTWFRYDILRLESVIPPSALLLLPDQKTGSDHKKDAYKFNQSGIWDYLEWPTWISQ